MMKYSAILEKQRSEFQIYIWKLDEKINQLPNAERSEIFKFVLNDFITYLKMSANNYSVELYYDHNNKPHIEDSTYKSISISHTRNFLAAQVHKENIAGVDIEYPREQLLKVQHKFLNEDELKIANNNLDLLCIFWTCKEALFKVYGTSNISLKNHINIKQMSGDYIIGSVTVNGHTDEYTLYSDKILINGLRYSYVVKKN